MNESARQPPPSATIPTIKICSFTSALTVEVLALRGGRGHRGGFGDGGHIGGFCGARIGSRFGSCFAGSHFGTTLGLALFGLVLASFASKASHDLAQLLLAPQRSPVGSRTNLHWAAENHKRTARYARTVKICS
jgi:hypothetical protein